MKKVLAVAIIALLFISTFAVLTQVTNAEPYATPKPNISISPPQKAAAVGESFSVDIIVSDVTPEMRVVGIQCRVLYNSEFLQATGVTEGSFMEPCDDTYFITSIDDDKAVYGGNVLIGVLCIPDENGNWASFPEGSGTLATITFEALALTEAGKLTIVKAEVNQALIINDKLQEVPCTVTDGEVQIGDVALDLQPSKFQIELGESFSVDVVAVGVDKDEKVTGIQFRLKYDSAKVEVTGVTEGPFLPSFGDTYFISSIDDDKAFWGPNVLVGNLLLPQSGNEWTVFPDGAGTVATITFVSKTRFKFVPTETPIELTNNLVINDDLNEVLSAPTKGTVSISAPQLSVQPLLVETALGESFSVDIVVSNINPAQRVTGIQFRLKYDSAKVEVTGVTEGPFMKSFGSTFFISSIDDDEAFWGPNVLVGDLLLPQSGNEWTVFPDGAGTVATITFTSIARPAYVPAETPLKLADNLLIDDELNEVPSTVTGGNVQIDLPPPALLTVYPPQSYAVVDHPLVVTVMINNLEAAWRTTGIQFRLCYDPTLLEIVDVKEGSFLKDSRWNKHGTLFISQIEVDAVYGPCVLVGDLLLPDDNGVWEAFPSGFGVIATFTLNPIHAAGLEDPPLTTTLTIENDLIVNDANEEIGEVLHTANDAYVIILPTQPTLMVDPPLTEVHGVGTTFSVNVDVSELSEGWKATSAQFRLRYDDEYFEVLSVTEGPFMKSFGDTFFISSIDDDKAVYGGNVLVGILLLPDEDGNWATFPTGSGTIATVTFNTTSLPRGLDQPPTHVNLGLVDPSGLVNDNAEDISTNLLGGAARIYPTHIADVNRDGRVNMLDIGYVARAFGAVPGHPRWNAEYDVVIDNVINMRDVGSVARNFGWMSV